MGRKYVLRSGGFMMSTVSPACGCGVVQVAAWPRATRAHLWGNLTTHRKLHLRDYALCTCVVHPLLCACRVCTHTHWEMREEAGDDCHVGLGKRERCDPQSTVQHRRRIFCKRSEWEWGWGHNTRLNSRMILQVKRKLYLIMLRDGEGARNHGEPVSI